MSKVKIDWHKQIEKKLNGLGKNLVKCDKRCKGITNKKDKGIFPRCLFYEFNDPHNKKGVIIIGMNPGKANNAERKELKEKWEENRNNIFTEILNYWKDKLKAKCNYYKKLREFAHCFGLSNIVWTEVAKCESDHKRKKDKDYLLNTFRTCANEFLKDEVEIIDEAIPNKHWPIIAAGREAFKASSYLFHERTVIGVPHPTGSRDNAFKKSYNTPKKKESITNKFKSDPPSAHWIYEKKNSR